LPIRAPGLVRTRREGGPPQQTVSPGVRLPAHAA
jgi:hypothetical protein